jgi:hypothetical protein
MQKKVPLRYKVTFVRLVLLALLACSHHTLTRVSTHVARELIASSEKKVNPLKALLAAAAASGWLLRS